jgi:hypothetical protein
MTGLTELHEDTVHAAGTKGANVKTNSSIVNRV